MTANIYDRVPVQLLGTNEAQYQAETRYAPPADPAREQVSVDDLSDEEVEVLIAQEIYQ